MKPEARIIAWDDCAFGFDDKKVRIVGAIFRGGKFLDGLLSTEIIKDGTDVTDKITGSVTGSRHYDQISYIMLGGVSFAGFNIADITKMSRATKLPVIVVIRKRPDVEKFIAAMGKLPDYSERKTAVRNAGNIYTYKSIFYQKAGLETAECEEIFYNTCTQSNVPEPLRVVHLIASGLSGESRGRA